MKIRTLLSISVTLALGLLLGALWRKDWQRPSGMEGLKPYQVLEDAQVDLQALLMALAGSEAGDPAALARGWHRVSLYLDPTTQAGTWGPSTSIQEVELHARQGHRIFQIATLTAGVPQTCLLPKGTSQLLGSSAGSVHHLGMLTVVEDGPQQPLVLKAKPCGALQLTPRSGATQGPEAGPVVPSEAEWYAFEYAGDEALHMGKIGETAFLPAGLFILDVSSAEARTVAAAQMRSIEIKPGALVECVAPLLQAAARVELRLQYPVLGNGVDAENGDPLLVGPYYPNVLRYRTSEREVVFWLPEEVHGREVVLEDLRGGPRGFVLDLDVPPDNAALILDVDPPQTLRSARVLLTSAATGAPVSGAIGFWTGPDMGRSWLRTRWIGSNGVLDLDGVGPHDRLQVVSVGGVLLQCEAQQIEGSEMPYSLSLDPAANPRHQGEPTRRQHNLTIDLDASAGQSAREGRMWCEVFGQSLLREHKDETFVLPDKRLRVAAIDDGQATVTRYGMGHWEHGRYRVTLFDPLRGCWAEECQIGQEPLMLSPAWPDLSRSVRIECRPDWIEDGDLVLSGELPYTLMSALANQRAALLEFAVAGSPWIHEVQPGSPLSVNWPEGTERVSVLRSSGRHMYISRGDLDAGHPLPTGHLAYVSGRVVAPGLASLEGVCVDLCSQNGQSVGGALQPSPAEFRGVPVAVNGDFSISGVTPGIYVLVVSIRTESDQGVEYSFSAEAVSRIPVPDEYSDFHCGDVLAQDLKR